MRKRPRLVDPLLESVRGSASSTTPAEDVPAASGVPVRARVLASAADLAVIGAWLGLLAAAGAVVRWVLPEHQRASDPLKPRLSPAAMVGVDAAVFAATVLPTGLYLALTEAGVSQGSLGKRLMGLQVVLDQDGGRPSSGRVILRTVVKLLPWQLGHLAVTRMNLNVPYPAVIYPTYVGSLAVPATSVLLALRDPAGRALHDRIAGTRVVRRCTK